MSLGEKLPGFLKLFDCFYSQIKTAEGKGAWIILHLGTIGPCHLAPSRTHTGGRWAIGVGLHFLNVPLYV